MATVLWIWGFWAAPNTSAFSSQCKVAGIPIYHDLKVGSKATMEINSSLDCCTSLVNLQSSEKVDFVPPLHFFPGFLVAFMEEDSEVLNSSFWKSVSARCFLKIHWNTHDFFFIYLVFWVTMIDFFCIPREKSLWLWYTILKYIFEFS